MSKILTGEVEAEIRAFFNKIITQYDIWASQYNVEYRASEDEEKLEKEIEEQKMFYKEKVNKLLGQKEINNVYLEKLLEELLESIRGTQYSMISEESTDMEEDMRAVDEATNAYMDHLKQLLERTETVQLGQFEVSSRTLIVGDPMYIHHDYEHLIQEIHSCQNGRWNAHILTVNTTDGEKICHQLIVKHETEMIDDHNYKWLKVGYISVDGGRAGIFNNMPLNDDTPVIEGQNNSDGYLVNTGVISTSGMGDGHYPVFVMKQNESIVAVKVLFIDADELDEKGIVFEEYIPED